MPLAMMLAAMVCWGSWTNTYRLARAWRLELFHLDYSIGVLLAALIAAPLGGAADAGPAAVLYTFAGGAALNAGNYLLMAGIARVGMTVAFPVSVGFSLVVSTVLSYLVNPMGDAALLAAGVALVFCAVVVNAWAYRSMARGKTGGGRGGLAMCFAAGVLFSICGPLVAKALALGMAPLATAVVYGAGSLAAAVPLVSFVFRGWPREYAAGGMRNHAAGVAGGLIWGAGMVLTFLAAHRAGMAVAGAVGQANPLVAAAWGIFVWKKFRGASARTVWLLALMIALYGAGLALLAWSFG